jgi:hypothetical protein
MNKKTVWTPSLWLVRERGPIINNDNMREEQLRGED